MVLHTEELEACIEVFLEEVEEDMEMNDLPPLENVTPLLVPAPAIPGFVPFAVSTGQRHIPPKSLLRWSTQKRSKAGGSLEGRVKVGFFSLALVIP